MKSTDKNTTSDKINFDELQLLPAGDFKQLEVKTEDYDGGFHIQSSGASDKRIISKRSALQEFTCR